MADIDVGDGDPAQFLTIGTPDEGPFTGVFDGNGKTISGLRRLRAYDSYVGLFGIVDGEDAQIKNVTLSGPQVHSETGRYIAALVGLLREGTVSNCHARAADVSGMNFVGGLVGKSDQGSVTDCTISAVVGGTMRVGALIGQSYYGEVVRCRAVGEVRGLGASWAIGGLIGENSSGPLTECRASCTVTGDTCVGGLAGDNPLAEVARCSAGGTVSGGSDVGGLLGRSNGGVITDCYAAAEVTGEATTGGLVGRHGPSCYCYVYTPGLVSRCYAAGPVNGDADAGGLIGLNERSNTEDSFWDIQVTGCKNSDGGEGKTTSQMRDQATYEDAGWDIVAGDEKGPPLVWRLTAKAYPRLEWEGTAFDLNADRRVDWRDYAVLARHWRQIDTGFWSSGVCITRDGIVDCDDLAELAGAWLTGER
jgi:hypothetical protein